MKDKKNSIIGALLMGLLFVGWLFWQQTVTKKNQEEQIKKLETEQVASPNTDSVSDEYEETPNSDTTQKIESISNDSTNTHVPQEEKRGIFAVAPSGKRELITIETDLFIAKLSTKGGSLVEFTLKDYLKWDKVPTQLIAERKGQLYLKFRSDYGEKIDTRDLYFAFDTEKNQSTISGTDSLVIKAIMQLSDGGSIEKEFVFHGNTYDFDCNVIVEDMDKHIPKTGYDFCWSGGLAYQEYNSVDESRESKAVVTRYNSIEELKNPKEEGKYEKYEGMIGYAAIKIKYFGMAIMPQPYGSFTGIANVHGVQNKIGNEGENNSYDVSLRIPYSGGKKVMDYKIYLGPLDYDILKGYELSDLVQLGWRFLIRPIGEYFIMPIFKFIHSLVGHWGLTLIIFAIFIKMILTPFTLPQMRTTQKTKLLAPILDEMRAKYADDSQAQQREQMKIYSEYGINPVGGCLPMLLQMPILFALFSVLRNAIELRQSTCFLWITDLSRPDVIFNFGFSIFGISQLTGLAFLMGITMFIQQKMTVTDPKQKAMVYMMPVMMTIMFAMLPSGLNLYYFIFNLLSIAQQVYINKFSRKKMDLEDLKRAPKKEGWMARKMREAQEMSSAQGKGTPNAVKKYGSIEEQNVNYRKKKKDPKKKK